ncbi:MAG: hypothetical protein GQ570_09535 [Helicobacteraceae bacterium]|nr:hypothetical protein [Helicobacteraceae bacterium]
MKKSRFDAILSFLLGASWAYVILGSLILYKFFFFFGAIYALFISVSFVFISFFMMLVLEALSNTRDRHEEIKKQTKLLEEIRDQLK